MKAAPLRCWENSGPVSLSEIFDWCVKREQVDMVLATVRSAEDMRGKRSLEVAVERTAHSLFRRHLIKELNASAWPGTRLTGHTARVYVARFDEELRARMVAMEDELFKWVHQSPKHLPEDISLFRDGGPHPVLVSITHEKHAYIIGAAESPPPTGFGRANDPLNRMMLTWDGPYFCLV